MQKDGEKPSLHCWGVAPPGRCNAPVPAPPLLPRPLPFAGEGAAHAVGAGGAGAAGVMGRDCSSVLLEITIAMLRAEEQKALLRHCLSFPPPPSPKSPSPPAPSLLGGCKGVGAGGGFAAPHRVLGGVSCPPPPQPGEGAGLEMCLEGNANQCLGLPQLGDGAVNKGAVPGCPFSPLPPLFFGQK